MATRKAKRIVPIPATMEEANEFLVHIGEAQRVIAAIEAEFTSQVSAFRQAADEELESPNQALSSFVLGLQFFAEDNQAAILANGQKTVQLTAGSFGWRLNRRKVLIRKKDLNEVLARIKQLDLAAKYIRIKEEPNKQALLQDLPAIVGIAYSKPKEVFFAEAKPDVPGTKVMLI